MLRGGWRQAQGTYSVLGVGERMRERRRERERLREELNCCQVHTCVEFGVFGQKPQAQKGDRTEPVKL